MATKSKGQNSGANQDVPTYRVAGFGRRLGALFYDVLLLSAILLLAAMPLPLIPETVQHQWPIQFLIRGYLLLVSFAFFAGFWTRNGQTLGMRAWHLSLVNHQGMPPSWGQALLRFVAAPLALLPALLGLVWLLWDSKSLAWHDRISGTRVLYWPDQATRRNMSSAKTLNTKVGNAAANKGGKP